MKNTFRIFTVASLALATTALCSTLTATNSYAQTSLDSLSGLALQSRGTLKTRSRVFNPFSAFQSSRLQSSTLGLPNQSARLTPFSDPFGYETANVAAIDPIATTSADSAPASPTPLTIGTISGGQSAPVAASSTGGWPWVPRPVRSTYRPPPRGSF